ncbi:MAG: S41 family peptidase [Chloroflexota bacterium]|nr:S41 family peptidase [Chloroflexota bacterium]
MNKWSQFCRGMARHSLTWLLIVALSGIAFAQGDLPLAPIVNDEGGVVAVTGTLSYTSLLFTMGVAQPVIILEDQAGFVDRNLGFLMPSASQTLAQLTSNFYESPVTYSLALPIQPQGSLRDVDNDGATDTGVQVYAVAYWNNVFGDPYLERRDLYGGGWSTAYVSTEVSGAQATLYEITGGKLIIYAPDAAQGFPADFGVDGLLFTDDDPIVGVPAGWTVVDLDAEPFSFDRSSNPVIDLIEPDSTALDDFSALSYTAAFDAMLNLFKREYAFTPLKGIDWAALSTEFRPRFERADAENFPEEYQLALRDFLWRIPDGHVAVYPLSDAIYNDLIARIGGGLGMAIRELSDGRTIATFITPGREADNAGITVGAEIVALAGVPIADWIGANVPVTSPFSTDHVRRLQQQIYAVRFPVGMDVEVTFISDGREVTTTLTADFEFESYDFANASAATDGYELPVEFELLDNGFVVARVWSFFDNDLLTIQLWERMIAAVKNNDARGLIIDMRVNGGGSGFLADQMAAYFFDEELVLGGTARYDDSTGTFFLDTNRLQKFYPPPEELRYDGSVAVLVGANCASACEFFAYDMSLEGRAIIVGETPTAGMGGGITDFAMPDDLFVRFTVGRAVDADGNIHIEGIGVVPDIVVPVTEESVLDGADTVLNAAIEALGG